MSLQLDESAARLLRQCRQWGRRVAVLCALAAATGVASGGDAVWRYPLAAAIAAVGLRATALLAAAFWQDIVVGHILDAADLALVAMFMLLVATLVAAVVGFAYLAAFS